MEILEWINQVGACQPAKDFAAQYSDNEQYYAGLEEPSFLIWGVTSRRPELGPQICCNLLDNAENVDPLTAPILALAVASSEEEVLQQQLKLITALTGQVRARRSQRHLDRAVFRLLRWKLGQTPEADIADEAGAIVAYVVRHTKLNDAQGVETIMAWMREEIPYDTWKQGL